MESFCFQSREVTQIVIRVNLKGKKVLSYLPLKRDTPDIWFVENKNCFFHKNLTVFFGDNDL